MLVLTGHVEGNPARDEDFDVWTRGKDVDQGWRRLEELLEIVNHKQALPISSA